eukprot:6289915-Alexandrium_andersonii.AAC.1
MHLELEAPSVSALTHWKTRAKAAASCVLAGKVKVFPPGQPTADSQPGLRPSQHQGGARFG